MEEPMVKDRSGVMREGDILEPVEDLASRLGIKDWELAGIMRMQGWAPGKWVSEKEIESALTAFGERPMGA